VAALVPELVSLLGHDRGVAVREVVAAAAVLQRLPAPTPELVAALRTAARNRSAKVRSAAIQALEVWKPLPVDLVPDLLALLQDRDPEVVSQATLMLAEINPPPAEFQAALVQGLRRPPDARTQAVLAALAHLNYQPVAADLPFLTAALPSLTTGYEATRLLGRAGPAACPALLELLRSGQAEIQRSWAALALGTIGPGVATILPELAELLGDPDLHTRCLAMQVVAGLGTAEALALLRPCFRENSPAVHSALMEGCGKIGAAALPLLPEILELVRLEDDSTAADRVRHMVVLLAAHSPDVVPGLRALLPGAEADVCYRVAKALGDIGPNATAARPDLEALVNHPHEPVRAIARWALGRMTAGQVQ
jgi:HEAT repeat protein